jgi:hypothetical protein
MDHVDLLEKNDKNNGKQKKQAAHHQAIKERLQKPKKRIP